MSRHSAWDAVIRRTEYAALFLKVVLILVVRPLLGSEVQIPKYV
jgi:hypothetical protein